MELLKQVNTYQVDNKEQAETKIKQVEAESNGIVTYKLTYKTKKAKGEIIAEWYVVEITEKYDD